MNDDIYLSTILRKYDTFQGTTLTPAMIASEFTQLIYEWGGPSLQLIAPVGSCVKGTATSLSSDLDLLLSFTSLDGVPNTNTRTRLKWKRNERDFHHETRELYESLRNLVRTHGFTFHSRRVAVQIIYSGLRIDIVPAIQVPDKRGYHWVRHDYVSDNDINRAMTNVNMQAQLIRSASLANEIRLLKIWRDLRSIHLPSLYLELLAIGALGARKRTSLSADLRYALRWLGTAIARAVIVDPANHKNVLSEYLLTAGEKWFIASSAIQSSRERSIDQIVW